MKLNQVYLSRHIGGGVCKSLMFNLAFGQFVQSEIDKISDAMSTIDVIMQPIHLEISSNI